MGTLQKRIDEIDKEIGEFPIELKDGTGTKGDSEWKRNCDECSEGGSIEPTQHHWHGHWRRGAWSGLRWRVMSRSMFTDHGEGAQHQLILCLWFSTVQFAPPKPYAFGGELSMPTGSPSSRPGNVIGPQLCHHLRNVTQHICRIDIQSNWRYVLRWREASILRFPSKNLQTKHAVRYFRINFCRLIWAPYQPSNITLS